MTAPPSPLLLIVDDTPANLTVVSELLAPHYRLRIANSGMTALRAASTHPLPDLILLDVRMADIDGYEVCKRLKASEECRHIPIIFLTAQVEADDETHGLSLGAVDYVTKPINPAVLLARVDTHVKLKAHTDQLAGQADFLEREVARRTEDLRAVQDVTILAMASLAETRDNETGNHIRRTQFYVRALAEHLRDHPRFSQFLTPENIVLLFKSAPLHDIGKVGIPDHILLKPGKFEPEEFEIMKTHTTIGRDAIEQAERALGTSTGFLTLAKEIAYSHQEKFDGSGYPCGLVGDAIPISARLMAVADVYDALICRRIYKEPMSHEAAVAILIEGRNRHFDPDILDAFLVLQEEFRAIAARFVDSDDDLLAKEARRAPTERLKTP